jgi:hypothetical protein
MGIYLEVEKRLDKGHSAAILEHGAVILEQFVQVTLKAKAELQVARRAQQAPQQVQRFGLHVVR